MSPTNVKLCDIFKETNRTKDGLLLAYEMIEFLSKDVK